MRLAYEKTMKFAHEKAVKKAEKLVIFPLKYSQQFNEFCSRSDYECRIALFFELHL